MKARTVFLSLALCCAGAALSFAQNPQLGTWKLNEAKSHIPAGAPKNTTVVYEMQGDNIHVTTDGTEGNGQPSHTDWTGKFDGKDYPLTGDQSADARSYTRVNARTLSLSNKKDGKVTISGRIVVSADGKVRTVTLHEKDPSGHTVSETAVYDRQ